MITNDALIGIITALAIIGSIHILESIVWVIAYFIQAYSRKASTRVIIGAEAGFNLQFGTSIWFAWKALTRKTRRGYNPSEQVPGQFSGMAFISFVSALCFSLVILLEVGVIYMSKPVTTYRYLSDGGLKVLAVGSNERLDIELNGVYHIEIGFSSFNDSVSARHFSSAYVNQLGGDMELSEQIENAMQQRQTNISIWTQCTIDGVNPDGSNIEKKNTLRKQANRLTFFFFDTNKLPIQLTTERTSDTLASLQTHIFTDFEEAEAEVMEAELFKGLGFECETLWTRVESPMKTKLFDCEARKGVEALKEKGTSAHELMDNARTEMARRIFRVTDRTVLWRSELVDGVSTPGKEFDEVTAAITGLDPSTTSFILLCIAAALGIVRLVTGTFFDHRAIAETFLFKAAANRRGLASPGNWDGWDKCEWTVYNSGDANYFGYTNQKWSEDYHTTFVSESARPIEKDAA